jgi:hypothetical protein
MQRTRNQRASHQQGFVRAADAGRWACSQKSRGSPVFRNFVGLIAGVLLHYLLTIAGSGLAWFLIVGRVDRAKIDYKDAVIRWMLWRTLALDPVVAVIAGACVAGLVRRSYWWLGGIATLPLFIYAVIRGADRIETGTFVVYTMLGFAAAFVVSRFKRTLVAA